MISLITPSYAPDFEACRLLCDSIDAFVTGFDVHYIVVAKEDLPLFAGLVGPRRKVLDQSAVLPHKFIKFPFQVRGRTYRWAPGILPIRGWHVQQLVKFGMTIAQPNARVMMLDSDNCFVRPFDVEAYADGEKIPMLVDRGAIDGQSGNHVTWLSSAHRLLGLEPPVLPANDFIGNLIVWDAGIVRAVLERIEAVSGMPWWKAICREREFSEYLIYGAAVSAHPRWMQRHKLVDEMPARTYWNGPALDAEGIRRLVAELEPQQVSIGIQSFTATPVELIRSVALGRAKEFA